MAATSSAVPDLAREVRKLAVPAILHSFLQTLVFVVDRVMLGRHGDASLAAMQLGGALEWSIWSVFAAFTVGTTARVGRHVGAGDRAGARRAALISLVFAVGFGSVLALGTPLVLRGVERLAPSVSAETMLEAKRYLSVTIVASPIVFVGATSIAVLQASGDTRTPLVIGIAANLLHIGLNRVLILGAFGVVPAFGAGGAGISTAITFGFEALLAFAALTQRHRPASLRAALSPSSSVPLERVSQQEVRALVGVALPAFVERVLYHVGFVSFGFLVARLGDEAMAANQALISVESICFLSGDGFGIAAAALVAQKLGAERPGEARAAASIAARYAMLTLTVCGVGAFLLRGVILPIFSRDAEVLHIGTRTMPILALAQPFMAFSIVRAQALRGAGRTREALVISLVGAVFVRLASTWFFAFVLKLGLVGVWLGSTTDWIVRTVLLAMLARRDREREEDEGAASGATLG